MFLFEIVFILVARRGLGFNPEQGGSFNKEFLPEIRRDGVAEPQSLFNIINSMAYETR